MAELKKLGYEPKELDGNAVIFPYVIENGPRAGIEIELGFIVPPNFPLEPPHGPCYRPGFLRASGLSGVHPGHSIGPAWDHWSRTFNGWARSDRTVRAYMRHIRRLNEEMPLPSDEDARAA